MKKTPNIFRAQQTNYFLKILGIFCGLVVIASLILLASTPANRGRIQGWFKGNRTQLVTKKDSPENTAEAGINGSAVINNSSQVAPLSFDDYLWGNIGAPVQLIIYEDFQCPFCAQFYGTVEQAKAEFGPDLVVAIRHFPLASHELALPAANAAECAGEQDKFFEMYRELFDENIAGTLSEQSIRDAGKKLGLDENKYTDCLTKTPYQAKILAQKEAVKKLGVGGTPASFINNEYFAGAVPYTDFTHPDGTTAEGLRSLIKRKLGK
jgi:protein-disulfide isomerase